MEEQQQLQPEAAEAEAGAAAATDCKQSRAESERQCARSATSRTGLTLTQHGAMMRSQQGERLTMMGASEEQWGCVTATKLSDRPLHAVVEHWDPAQTHRQCCQRSPGASARTLVSFVQVRVSDAGEPFLAFLTASALLAFEGV